MKAMLEGGLLTQHGSQTLVVYLKKNLFSRLTTFEILFLEKCIFSLAYQPLHGIHYIAKCKQSNKREIADTATVSAQTEPNFFDSFKHVGLSSPSLALFIFIFFRPVGKIYIKLQYIAQHLKPKQTAESEKLICWLNIRKKY